jgi:hypothetical protein
LLKISHLPREQDAIVDYNDRGDLEVHRADANSLLPQSFKLVRRMLVERQDLPFRKKIKKPDEAFVIRYLPMNIGIALNEP